MHVTTKDEEGPQTSHFTLQISVDRPTKFELGISDFRRNSGMLPYVAVYLSNRKRFPCLHSLI